MCDLHFNSATYNTVILYRRKPLHVRSTVIIFINLSGAWVEWIQRDDE